MNANTEWWIRVLIILAIVILPAINRMFASVREQRNASRGPLRPKSPPDQSAASDIEEFLRRANRGASGPAETPPRRPAAASPALSGRTTASPVPAEIVGDKSASGRVADHVKSYLDASEFKRRSASMADDMAEDDEKRSEHRQEVFGHQLGQLGAAEPAVDSPKSAAAAATAAGSAAALDLAAIFMQPENLRQAILIQEVLQRPEHRWE